MTTLDAQKSCFSSPSWYPLPDDYPDLSKEGQRDARLSVCRQWTVDVDLKTPEQLAKEFVTAWEFFRSYYLGRLPAGVFYKRKRPSPPAHYQMVWDIMAYNLNVHAAPRGSAKSTVIGKEVPLLFALAQPHHVTLEVLASDEKVQERFGDLQEVFVMSDEIREDFGDMKPNRASGRKWTLSILQLNNGSVIRGTSVEARKRGTRPDLIILDDPEFDPSSPGKETILKGQLESLLFRQLLPMLDEENQRFEWIGTLINCQSALHAAVHGDDPRFTEFYNRRIYSASHVDPETGKTVYFWPAKWGEDFLAKRRRQLGDLAYEAEYQNNPVSDQARAFTIDDELDTYVISGSEISWMEGAGSPERITMSYEQWLGSLGRLFTIDLGHTRTIGADFSGVLAVGIDKPGVWWVLDLWLGRVAAERLMTETWRMGLEWQPQVVGVEAIAGQEYFRQWFESQADIASAALPWKPRCIWPIRYPPRLSKEDRINTLIPRMARHRVKFPLHLKTKWPMSELWHQVQMYTPDGLSLAHDDAIDMLAMVNYCPKFTPAGLMAPEYAKDLFELLSAGNILDPATGLPLLSAMDVADIPGGVMQKFLDSRRKIAHNTRPKDGAGQSTLLRDRGGDRFRIGGGGFKPLLSRAR